MDIKQAKNNILFEIFFYCSLVYHNDRYNKMFGERFLLILRQDYVCYKSDIMFISKYQENQLNSIKLKLPVRALSI